MQVQDKNTKNTKVQNIGIHTATQATAKHNKYKTNAKQKTKITKHTDI